MFKTIEEAWAFAENEANDLEARAKALREVGVAEASAANVRWFALSSDREVVERHMANKDMTA